MRVYLDNCAFNRPFDNQNYIRIRLETEAKLLTNCSTERTLFWRVHRQNVTKGRTCENDSELVLFYSPKRSPEHRNPTLCIQIGWIFRRIVPSFTVKFGVLIKNPANVTLCRCTLLDVKLMNPTEFVKVMDDYDN